MPLLQKMNLQQEFQYPYRNVLFGRNNDEYLDAYHHQLLKRQKYQHHHQNLIGRVHLVLVDLIQHHLVSKLFHPKHKCLLENQDLQKMDNKDSKFLQQLQRHLQYQILMERVIIQVELQFVVSKISHPMFQTFQDYFYVHTFDEVLNRKMQN